MSIIKTIYLYLHDVKKNKAMANLEVANTALLVHIEHSRPIPIQDFASTIEAYGRLYSSFLTDNGYDKEPDNTGLFVEKIEHNCIDIHLCELVQAAMLPFAENINTILEFGRHIKTLIEYFTKSKREDELNLTLQQLKDLKEIFNVTAGDQGGITEVSVIDRTNNGIAFENCTFNFNESNSAQNQISKKIARMKTAEPDTEGIYKRVLMTVKQHRNDDSGKGNKAIIDSIFKNKVVNLLFDDDELKNQILLSDDNPVKKAYQVDVEVQTVSDKVVAYKVIALHDIIDLEG